MKRLSSSQARELTDSRESRILKFVRVGEIYRFIEVRLFEHHGMLIDHGEEALAAGTIVVNKDSWKVVDRYSSTLNVHCDSKALSDLKELFVGRKFSE